VRDTLHRDGLVVVVPAYQLLPFAYHFSRRDFAEPARLRDLLAAERVVGVAHLDDAATFAATGRELAVVLPEALAAGSDALAARLAAQGYAAGARGAVPGLVLLRYRPAPAAGAS
jgi:hypothetical protein